MNLRTSLSIFFLTSSVAYSGCDAEPPQASAEPHTRDGRLCGPGGCSDDSRAIEPRVTTGTPDPEACAELRQEARALVDEFAPCGSDRACSPVLAQEVVGDTCVPLFQCYLPTVPGFAGEEFAERAAEIDARYREVCGGCPDATCVERDLMLSVCESGSCELDVARFDDWVTTR